MGSKHIPLRRATSAGYRMPDRTKTKLTSTSSVSLSHAGTKHSPILPKKDKEKEAWGMWSGRTTYGESLWMPKGEVKNNGMKIGAS
ncbi:unnamed protein product [Staurois parvus]|uniref:Uncharacterized protein n=1 Tax=Staurois parvus TaxID=386267 RepID=A0ABN9CK86_9NEOB|nr:unnamed protein product [Staurois parvus]